MFFSGLTFPPVAVIYRCAPGVVPGLLKHTQHHNQTHPSVCWNRFETWGKKAALFTPLLSSSLKTSQTSTTGCLLKDFIHYDFLRNRKFFFRIGTFLEYFNVNWIKGRFVYPYVLDGTFESEWILLGAVAQMFLWSSRSRPDQSCRVKKVFEYYILNWSSKNTSRGKRGGGPKVLWPEGGTSLNLNHNLSLNLMKSF